METASQSDSMISREEIHAVLGYWEDNPCLVLQEIIHRLNDQNRTNLFPHIRFLLVCVKILCRYKNNDSRNVIMKMNSRLLNLVYSTNKNPDFKVFYFMLSIIFHFRNCVTLNDLEIAGQDLPFIDKVREKMIAAKIPIQLDLALAD
jgi:hypothetical protein